MAKKKSKTKNEPALIKNYGLFWEHDNVNWSEKPALIGNARNQKERCFDEQVGIYVLYNHNKEVLYVGQTGRGEAKTLLSRLKDHNRDDKAGWWKYFSWFGLRDLKKDGSLTILPADYHKSRGEILDSLEGILIAAINPQLNKQGEKLGTWFKQAEPKEEGDSDAENIICKIDCLTKEIKELKKLVKK